MCTTLDEINQRIAELGSELAKHVSDATLTAGLKATIDTERDTRYLDRREHKFLGHGGQGCPDA